MQNQLWYSIIPALVAIIIAIWTKQVIPSLLIGLWLGSFIITGSLLVSISKTVDYIISVLTDSGNLDVLLFLYVFSGLVALIQLSGGVKAFSTRMSKYITNEKKTLLATWVLLPITFIDCGFRVVAAGSIIKPLAKKYSVSNERLAYMLNNSASPVIVLIPIATTYIGYILGVLNQGMSAADINGSAFHLFITTLPYHFFSYTSIIIAILSIWPTFNFGIMKKEIRSTKNSDKSSVNMMNGGQLVFQMEMAEDMENKDKADTAKDQMGVSTQHDSSSVLTPRLINLLLPIMILIPLSFYLMWWGGRSKAVNQGILEVFAAANASRAMFLALFVTTLITFVLYLFQGMKLKTMTDHFIKGGNKLMTTIVILALAWPISNVSQDLGLTQFIKSTLAGNLSPNIVPLLIFSITGAVTYFIGSSWGGWALMMPIAIPLAATTGGSIAITAAAVFSGGTFGDVTSPVSGMTAMASGISEADHMKYIRAMTPYNLLAAFFAAILFIAVPIFLNIS